jgi:hypothetical protein
MAALSSEYLCSLPVLSNNTPHQHACPRFGNNNNNNKHDYVSLHVGTDRPSRDTKPWTSRMLGFSRRMMAHYSCTISIQTIQLTGVHKNKKNRFHLFWSRGWFAVWRLPSPLSWLVLAECQHFPRLPCRLPWPASAYLLLLFKRGLASGWGALFGSTDRLQGIHPNYSVDRHKHVNLYYLNVGTHVSGVYYYVARVDCKISIQTIQLTGISVFIIIIVKTWAGM